MRLGLRDMKENDIPIVYSINNRSFTTDAWSKESIEREFKLSYSLKFVFEKNGEAVGYAIIWLIKDEAFIMTFAIAPEHRGYGLGKEFLKILIDKLREKARVIQLDVRKSNIPAIRLYKRLGFRVVRERHKFYSDGESALVMELELSPAL